MGLGQVTGVTAGRVSPLAQLSVRKGMGCMPGLPALSTRILNTDVEVWGAPAPGISQEKLPEGIFIRHNENNERIIKNDSPVHNNGY